MIFMAMFVSSFQGYARSDVGGRLCGNFRNGFWELPKYAHELMGIHLETQWNSWFQ